MWTRRGPSFAALPLESASLEEIIRSSAEPRQKALFNAAAQAWNHAFYWRSMRPGGGGEASGAIAQLIGEGFGSQRAFSQEFVTAASDQFGSGWAWLVLDDDRLRIIVDVECRDAADHDASAAVDDRRVGARLLSGFSAATPRLHRRISGASGRLGLRQSEPERRAARASTYSTSPGIYRAHPDQMS